MKNKLLLTFFLLIFCNFTLSAYIIRSTASSYPFISGDTFRAFCDFIIDETQNNFDHKKLRNGDTIFVRTEELNYFFASIHPSITKKYILVTHNSHFSVPGQFAPYLSDEKLFAWFGKNVSECLPKLYPIPLGIANSQWPHGNINILKQVIDKLPVKKNKLLYLNISTWTHPMRVNFDKFFSKLSFCTKANKKTFSPYLQDLAESHFVLSPRGSGTDCHRTWEALLCGSIPIVESSGIDSLFSDLPVVIISDWHEVTESFLHEKLNEFSKLKFNMEKIYAEYWFNEIRKAQKLCRESCE